MRMIVQRNCLMLSSHRFVAITPSIPAAANMQITDQWDIGPTCNYIIQNGYVRITLQFPDSMLHDSPTVAGTLQSHLAARGSVAKVYVLADTSYNPLSVDEVAAAHVNADCLVHYGYASLNPVSRIPALCVLPKAQLDVQQCTGWVAEQLASTGQQLVQSCSTSEQQGREQQQQCAVLCCDQRYLHLLPQLQEALLLAYQGPLQLVFAESAPVQLQPQSSTAAERRPAGQSCGSSSCCLSAAEDKQQQQQQAQNSACGGSACTAVASGSDQQGCWQQAQQQQLQPTAEAGWSPSGSSCSSSLPPVGGLVWQLPKQASNSSTDETCSSSSSSARQPVMVWLGPFDSPALTHLQLTHSAAPWLLLDPATQTAEQGLLPDLHRLLKRRYYLVERARSATMIGLLVGTLGAAGYLQALNKLRELASKAGKKTYTLLMGKPNPAKLANFPEIEVFVMIADPQGLILDSKEYLNPIITPHEAHLAFTGQPLDQATYRLDFGGLLQDSEQPQGSKAAATAAPGIGGNISSLADDEDESEEQQQLSPGWGAASGALAVAGSSSQGKAVGSGFGSRTGQQVQVHSAAQYLVQHRTYKGLETPATGGEILAAEKAVPGRCGRAAVYEDEPAP